MRPLHIYAVSLPWSIWIICIVLVLLYGLPSGTFHVSRSDSIESDWHTLPVGTVRWWLCGESPRLPRADVPTDYHDRSAGVTKVALGRYNATKSPRKGMVIFNPGGPGGAGKEQVILSGSELQAAGTGEHYDIVGFDPRGIGDTEPATKCFPPGQSREFKLNTVIDKGFDFAGNIGHADLRASLLRQQVELDALVRTQYALCGVTMGQSLRYMGTTTVVRDIGLITTALEGPESLINYYSGSYGSVIGQYMVNMFPDRIGKVVLDSIVDADIWANEPNYKWARQWLSSTEDAYKWFLEACAKAGPKGCSLATEESGGPVELEDKLETFLNKLFKKPLTVMDDNVWGIVTSGMARTLLFRSLREPERWPTFAAAFFQAMQGDGRALLNLHHDTEPLFRDMERQAVSCNDAYRPPLSSAPTNDEIVDEVLDVTANVTRFAASVLTAPPDAGCQYWPVVPPERFTGPWNHTLKNPILVLSNTADPVTPITSARKLKRLLGDSAVLALQNGPGHATFSVPTPCTINKTRMWFTDGILPEDGHICEIDRSALFPIDGGNTLQGRPQTVGPMNMLAINAIL